MEKRENSSNQYFLLFPQCLLPNQKKKKKEIVISAISNLSSANALNLDQAKILSLGKTLTRYTLTLYFLLIQQFEVYCREVTVQCHDVN